MGIDTLNHRSFAYWQGREFAAARPSAFHASTPLHALAGAVSNGPAHIRQSRALLALEECMLQDIGLTWGEAEAEARKPFWRA